MDPNHHRPGSSRGSRGRGGGQRGGRGQRGGAARGGRPREGGQRGDHTRQPKETNEDIHSITIHKRQNAHKGAGFLTLEKLTKCDTNEILTELNRIKLAFNEILQKAIERLDTFVIILEISYKVCESTFNQLKVQQLLEICNSEFIKHLTLYLMDLPYAHDKRKNSLYWNDQIGFWKNFILVLETIIKISPSTACKKCRALIDTASKSCLDGLKEKHGFELPEEFSNKLSEMRSRIIDQDKIEEEEIKPKKEHKLAVNTDEEPPTSFRELGVLPNDEDLLQERPFLRPNIINGAYQSVEHYLDVQFRLLREDCFGPVRIGISQYHHDPNRRRFDNIRVFRNVTFVGPYVTTNSYGHLIQVDSSTKRHFKNIKWKFNKRLLFGALLLLTKDCKSFIVATVLDRDAMYLSDGKIPVSIMDTKVDFNKINVNDKFVLIESDVYFEPYFLVLKALQDTELPNKFAMKRYIVDVEPSSNQPEYAMLLADDNYLRSAEELELNDSQYEAYKLALTHEFAVIQGPPGTGKTYMGVKVAKTLLNMFKRNICTLLIICYTNHALDQFLYAISCLTNSIVRIGGQSRMEEMKRFNLIELRKGAPRNNVRGLYYDKKRDLSTLMIRLRELQNKIVALDTGIVNLKVLNALLKNNNDVRRISERYKTLCAWLFELMPCDYTQPLIVNANDIESQINNKKNNDDYNDVKHYEEDLDINLDTEVGGFFEYLIRDVYKNVLDLMKSNDGRNNIIYLLESIETFKRMKLQADKTNLDDIPVRNPLNMPLDNRWMLYFRWVSEVKQDLLKNVKPIQVEADSVKGQYEEARTLLDLSLMRECRVVGMTTTGAARHRRLINELAPPIVIVEEAAEVLEQHIVTSLPEKCQHLILIGDHKQLRPSAAHIELSRHYDIEVSLFERMIQNQMHSKCLSVQHRMRPEIAALITPHIYENLENHPSVETFCNVRGLNKNLFFFTHSHPESECKDSSSKENTKEADLVLGLANYLVQQDYKPTDVTILAAYTAQMFYMNKQRQYYAFLANVKITVVDNYQGEESKIILLSLVRNNLDNKIGFLGTENRICVALSRAREGLYIFGNISMLKNKSELWEKINTTLEGQSSVGTTLELKCQYHDFITHIINANDFEKVPEGGCLQKCSLKLSCSHDCPLVCHGYDKNHTNVKCNEKCERILCELGHVCPRPCMSECGPCQVKLPKTLLCGHVKHVPCHVDPKNNIIDCPTIVKVTLPRCGHEAEKSCSLDIMLVACPVQCVARLACGHACARSCHVTSDPDHERYACQKPCVKRKAGCTYTEEEKEMDHSCQKQCHETCDPCEVEVTKKRKNCKHSQTVPCKVDVNTIPCLKNCARLLECNHHCKKKCSEPCGDCRQMVQKVIPECGHTIKLACKITPLQSMCTEKCKKVLACGHPCPGVCGQPCDEAQCTEYASKTIDSKCGHKVTLPCKIYKTREEDELAAAALRHCAAACAAPLACGHACAGSCGACRQGRLHAPCASRCDKPAICGHICKVACSEICPPCDEPCAVRCQHSECKQKCGKPCNPCEEKCTRQCAHVQCSRRCGQACSAAACAAACARRLACGHACRGLCGAACPPVCALCDPASVPKDFAGFDYEPDARFIVLEDCNHIIEVDDLDNWMHCKTETIGIKLCPFCRTPIIRSTRYKDLINNTLKNEINPIKEKSYGTPAEIKLKKLQLSQKINEFQHKYKEVMDESRERQKTFMTLKHFVMRNKNTSLMQININFLYLNILETMFEKYDIYNKSNMNTLKSVLVSNISLICEVLVKNVRKISNQQQRDIHNEIKRMHAIIEFEKILNTPEYSCNKTNQEVNSLFQKAEKAILGFDIYVDEAAMDILDRLQRTIKSSNVVSRQELDMVVQAIGLKQGHWFKCPNGHFYCIGECGGAMEERECPECKEKIGGTQHTLLRSNALATEVDGATFPAWSQQYNNMRNFMLD